MFKEEFNFCYDFDEHQHFDDIPRGNWRTASGELIKIKYMSSSHLIRTVLLLRRTFGFKEARELKIYKRLIRECRKRNIEIV